MSKATEPKSRKSGKRRQRTVKAEQGGLCAQCKCGYLPPESAYPEEQKTNDPARCRRCGARLVVVTGGPDVCNA